MKLFKIFMDPIIGLERWLNVNGRLHRKLISLSHTGTIYEFEELNNQRYEYRVIPTRDMKSKNIDSFIDTLKKNNYSVFVKSSNYLKYSLYNYRLKAKMEEDYLKIYKKNNKNKELIIIMKDYESTDVLKLFDGCNYDKKNAILTNMYLIAVYSIIIFFLYYDYDTNLGYINIIFSFILGVCALKSALNIMIHLFDGK